MYKKTLRDGFSISFNFPLQNRLSINPVCKRYIKYKIILIPSPFCFSFLPFPFFFLSFFLSLSFFFLFVCLLSLSLSPSFCIVITRFQRPCQRPMYYYPYYYPVQGQPQQHPLIPPQPTLYLNGPPLKPKQTGYSLWIGNLPFDVSIFEILQIFGFNNISSVFLIQKTFCAFVNFDSEHALNTAKDIFRANGEKIRNKKIMIKVQKQEDALPSSSSSSSSLTSSQSAMIIPAGSNPDQEDTMDELTSGLSTISIQEREQNTQARFFICKSLTLDELRVSQKLGIWSTQSKNVALFNRAFQTCQNVYLIFSANRSGHFFGYARMASPIHTTPIQTSITYQNGQLFHDPLRQILFWEIQQNAASQNYTNFKVQWMSPPGKTIPFHNSRVKNLKNPYNENKYLKIARDGTEVEPSVGNFLIQLFHQ